MSAPDPGPTGRAAVLPSGEATVILPDNGLRLTDLAEVWRSRELIGFLALRDVRVRYKQSFLGAAWAVLQPLLTMAVFTGLFGLLLGRGRQPGVEGVPYAISTYCALVPWQLFARSLTASGESLVANQHLITKVYFPRLIAPIAPVVAALVDFALAFAVLLGMLAYEGISPGLGALALPGFALLAVAAALGLSLWLSALNAVTRDVRHALPFLVQTGMFLTPVVYTTASIAERLPGWALGLYQLNPMAGVVEGFRWGLLGGPAPSALALAGSSLATLALLVGGLFFFRRMERHVVDVV